jgi:hypothetical protein
MNTTSIKTDNQNTILGCNTTYDTMLAIEALIIANPMMSTLRDMGKLNKTSLIKMALMEFLSAPVSTRKLKRLFVASNNDDKFRAVLQGGKLD